MYTRTDHTDGRILDEIGQMGLTSVPRMMKSGVQYWIASVQDA